MTKPKVAIIGLEASGKTVLMTVLAKKLSQTVHQGYFLDPKGTATIKYIEGVWDTLQHWDWPPSTPPGEMFNLKWSMRITPDFSGDGQSYEADVHLVDAAGQDMRQLFGYDDAEDVPSYLRPLADYCMSADILLIALNIKDYVGESDSARRIENQATIKAALDMLQKSNQHVAIIFTQMDQYQSYIDQAGGLENFCKEKLPYIYNSYVANSHNSLISVAAVNDTEIVEKEDGMMVRVPKPNFSSKGLEDVCNWLAGQVVAMSNRETAEKRIEDQRLEQLVAAEEKRLLEQQQAADAKTKFLQDQIESLKKKKDNSGWWGCLILLIIGGIIFFAFPEIVKNLNPNTGGSYTYEPKPEATGRGGPYCEHVILWGTSTHRFKADVEVLNRGSAGTFQVTVTVKANGRTVGTNSDTILIGREETKSCTIIVNLSVCPQETNCVWHVDAKRVR